MTSFDSGSKVKNVYRMVAVHHKIGGTFLKLFRLMIVKNGFYVKSSSGKRWKKSTNSRYCYQSLGTQNILENQTQKSYKSHLISFQVKNFLLGQSYSCWVGTKFRIVYFRVIPRKRSKALNNLWQCEPNFTIYSLDKSHKIWYLNQTIHIKFGETKRNNVKKFWTVLFVDLNV